MSLSTERHGRLPKIRPRRTALLLAALLIASCGGGGGSGGTATSTTDYAVMFVDSTVSQAATTADSPPVLTLPVTVIYHGNIKNQVFVDTNTTNNGVSALEIHNDVSVVAINIVFKSPATLGVGTYQDTVTVKLCYDQNCTQPINGSPQSVAVTYVVSVAPPLLDSLVPFTTPAGGPAFALTVNARYINNQSVVLWNGAPRPTSFVSNTQLSAQISAADIANVGSNLVMISNQATGGPQSSSLPFMVVAPTVASISPASSIAGAPGFTMSVTGSDFESQSTVLWNGSARATTFISSTQLAAQITTADLLNAGAVSVAVANGPGTGATTGATTFTIQPLPALVLASVSPRSLKAGGPAYSMTLLGNGFTTASSVTWNASPRVTSYVSSTELLAQISAADIAAPGSAAVVVLNPASQGGASSPLTVTIDPPSIDAVAFQITPAHSGQVTFKSASLPASSSWSVDVGGHPSYGLIADGKVFVTVFDGTDSQLLALDQKTGAMVWGPVSLSGKANAVFDSGAVYVLSTVSGKGALVQSLDAVTGHQNWATQISSQPVFTAAPAVGDGFVYVVGLGSGGTLYALDQAGGALVWTKPVEGGDDSTPALAADAVYLTYPCWTYSLRPATGETNWFHTRGCDGGGGATPVLANAALYAPDGFGTYNGNVYDARTGAALGAYTADNPPAIDTNRAYLLQSGSLRAMTLSNGSVAWSFVGDGSLVTSPIVINQYVIVASSSGNVYGVDAATGSKVWQVNVGSAIPAGAGWGTQLPISGLTAGDGLLVVPGTTTITAYTISTSP